MSENETTDQTAGDDVRGSAETVVEVTEVDIDGDGVTDVVEVVATTVFDVDGDGVPDVVHVATAVGADLDGDGVIDDDEIEASEEIYVREVEGEPDEG
jgi:hypothetical protein